MKPLYYNSFQVLVVICFLLPGTVLSQASQKQVKVDTVNVLVSDTIKATVIRTPFIKADTIKAMILQTETGKKAKEKKETGVATDSLVIDFKTKKIKSWPENIKKGEFYKIVIDRINMNLYKVSYKNNDSTITSTVSFPTFEMAGLETLTSLLGELDESVVAMQDRAPPPESINGVKKARVDCIKTSKVDSDSVKAVMSSCANYLTEKGETLNDINRKIDSLSLSVQTLSLSYLIEDDSTWNKELKDKLDTRKIFIESDTLRRDLKKLSDEIQQKKSNYQGFYEANEDVIYETLNLKKFNKKINASFTAILTAGDKIYATIGADRVAAWLRSVIHLDNNSEWKYRSLPMQLNGDFTDLEISIEPKKKEFGLPVYQTTIRFPDYSRWHIGAGMGFYYGFDFKNQSYSILANPVDSTTTEYTLMDEEMPKGEAGIATLLHVGRNIFNSDWFGFNFAIGPALSFSKTPKPRMAAGLGLVFGLNSKQKITINGLGMAGYVDRLSNAYEISETKTASPEDVPEKVTVSKLAWSKAISIGYIYKF